MLSIVIAASLAALPSSDSRAPVDQASLPSAKPLELSLTLDGPLLGASAAMFAATVVINQTHSEAQATGSTQSVPWFDKVALGRGNATQDEVSSILQYALVVGVPLTLALSQWGGRANDLVPALIVVESLVASEAVCQLTKSLVHRPRPYAYAHGSASGEADRSFYSGHTTVSFAAVVSTLMVLDELPPELSTPLVIGALGLATTVGVLRVTSGRHFPSDVVTGAVIGATIGWVVPTLHRGDRQLSVVVSPLGLALTGQI